MKSVVNRLAAPVAVALGLAGLTMPFGLRAEADSIISTNTEQVQGKNGPVGVMSTSSSPTAQQFTLSQEFTIESIDITVQSLGDPAPDVALSIYSSSGSNLGSLLYTDVSATALPSSYGDATFSFSGANLSAGTYWVELTDSGSNGVRWGESALATGISNSNASINDNTFLGNLYYGDSVVMMELDAPAAVPEPGSLLMVAVGGLMVVGLTAVEVRRRRVVTA